MSEIWRASKANVAVPAVNEMYKTGTPARQNQALGRFPNILACGPTEASKKGCCDDTKNADQQKNAWHDRTVSIELVSPCSFLSFRCSDYHFDYAKAVDVALHSPKVLMCRT